MTLANVTILFVFLVLFRGLNLSLNRTIYVPHIPRPLQCNERLIGGHDLHLVVDIGLGRALMAKYTGPYNAEPRENPDSANHQRHGLGSRSAGLRTADGPRLSTCV